MDQHFDAERLAAFADGSLSAAERAAVEAHAADCAQCLQLLAAMARTHEDPRPSPGVWRLPVFVRWGAPFAAAATGVALWFYVLDEPRKEPFATQSAPAAREQAKLSAPRSSSDEELATKGAPEMSPTADAPRPDAKVGQRAAAAERKELSSEKALQESRDSVANFRTDKSAEVPQQRAEYSLRREAAKGKLETSPPPPPPPTVTESVAVTAAASPPAPSSPASPPAAASEAAGAPAKPARPPSSSAVAETVTVTRDRAAADKFGDTAALRQRLGAVAAIEASAPDRRFRWRVYGALIERSIDGGATWVAQTAAPRARVLAIASPSANVAWFVGSAGTVFVFSDGTWTHVAFPESVNLAAVSAANNREAQITTVDGRVFRTTDGGQTWALQETPPPAF